METQKDEVVVKKNKKFVVPAIISIIAVFFIVAVVVIVLTISSSGKDRKLQAQLDLGEKYISEMNYEQAIVAYEAVIEIDPMSVDAYLGLASVYEAQEEYEKALEVLQLGYEKTQSDSILQEINRIKELISQDGNEQEIEIEGDSQYPIAVPGRVVEGIYHNPYYEYPLIAEDKDFLVQIIAQAEQGNYEAALDLMDNDRLIAIVETFSDGENYINAMVNDKKVHMFTEVFNDDIYSYQLVNLIVLPIEMGNGYYFSKMYGSGDEYVSYGYGECKEGVFWGNYNGKDTSVFTVTSTSGNNEPVLSINTTISEYNVPLVNGLYDGQYEEYCWSDLTNTDFTSVKTYDMGLIKYWNLQEVEYENCTYVCGYYANGEEVSDILFGSLEYNKEWLDTYRQSIASGLDIYEYCEIDGGYRYYLW